MRWWMMSHKTTSPTCWLNGRKSNTCAENQPLVLIKSFLSDDADVSFVVLLAVETRTTGVWSSARSHNCRCRYANIIFAVSLYVISLFSKRCLILFWTTLLVKYATSHFSLSNDRKIWPMVAPDLVLIPAYRKYHAVEKAWSQICNFYVDIFVEVSSQEV